MVNGISAGRVGALLAVASMAGVGRRMADDVEISGADLLLGGSHLELPEPPRSAPQRPPRAPRVTPPAELVAMSAAEAKRARRNARRLAHAGGVR